MIKDLDELLDKNLKLIYDSPKQQIQSNRFVKIDGRTINNKDRGIEFSRFMEDKNLITVNNTLCTLTRLGLEIQEKGGWIEYSALKKENELKQQEKERIREEKQDEGLDLDLELKNFKIEASEYQKRVTRKIVVIGILITIANFLIPFFQARSSDSENTNPQDTSQETMQEQMQLLSKQKDSLLYVLEMKVDSLHAPIIKNNSSTVQKPKPTDTVATKKN